MTITTLDKQSCFLLFIINGSTVLDIAQFFVFRPNHYRTRGHSIKIVEQIFANILWNIMFASRAIDYWNNLPENIVTSSTLIQF